MPRTVDQEAAKEEHMPAPDERVLKLWYAKAEYAIGPVFDWPLIIRRLIAEVWRLRDAQDEKG